MKFSHRTNQIILLLAAISSFFIWHTVIHPQIITAVNSYKASKDVISNIEYITDWTALLAAGQLNGSMALYLLLSLLSIIPFILFFYFATKKRTHRKHNAAYLKEVMESENPQAATTTLPKLLNSLTDDPTEYQAFEKLIEDDILPIQNFLYYADQNVNNILIIEGKWGCGKTTAALISILNHDFLNRYIYESTFKYASNITEYINDILKTFYEVLEELGLTLNVKSTIATIAQNLNTEPSTFFNSLIQQFTPHNTPALSSELIHSLNIQYKNLELQAKLILIIDDIDRLQGNDIIKLLSFISTIRKLTFVKIIIPLDTSSVIKQLNNINIYKPENFIQKYLTGAKIVNMRSNAEYVKQISIQKIKALHTAILPKNTNFDAAWAAILLRIVANRITSNVTKFDWESSAFLNWLDPSTFDSNDGRDTDYWQPPADKIDTTSLSLINHARHSIRACLPNVTYRPIISGFDDHKPIAAPDISLTCSGWTDVRKFEDIIINIKYTANNIRIVSDFTPEHYDRFVKSWIFEYALTNWHLIDTNLRVILNIIENDNKEIANLEPIQQHIQFAQMFNTLFPEASIKITPHNET